MSSRYLVPGCVILATLFCSYLWSFVLDTPTNRSIVSEEIQSLVRQSKAEPANRRPVDELLRRAKGYSTFEATIATVALGDLGDAAAPRIKEIAALMQSENSFVRREAAHSLEKLGPRSAPALNVLKEKVRTGSPNDDETWYAAAAIGEIGEPAIGCLPLLQSKLGTGAVQFDACLRRAIKNLEDAKLESAAGNGSGESVR